MTKIGLFFQNPLVDHIGVYSDTKNMYTLCFPVVMIVFDFDDISPLQHIAKWKQMVDEKTEEAFFFLVGSKRDIVVIT